MTKVGFIRSLKELFVSKQLVQKWAFVNTTMNLRNIKELPDNPAPRHQYDQ